MGVAGPPAVSACPVAPSPASPSLPSFLQFDFLAVEWGAVPPARPRRTLVLTPDHARRSHLAHWSETQREASGARITSPGGSGVWGPHLPARCTGALVTQEGNPDQTNTDQAKRLGAGSGLAGPTADLRCGGALLRVLPCGLLAPLTEFTLGSLRGGVCPQRPDASSSRAVGLGLHVGSMEEGGTGDHGGSRTSAAPEALLSATCSLQPHGGPHAALVSEQGKGKVGGRKSQNSPEQHSPGERRAGTVGMTQENRKRDVSFGGGLGGIWRSWRVGKGRGVFLKWVAVQIWEEKKIVKD